MSAETPASPAGRSKGCLVALGVTATLAVMAILGLGALLSRLSHSPLVKDAVAKRSHRSNAVMAAMSAVGTKELKAIGCSQALVFEGNEMDELVGDLVDAGRQGDLERVKVICRGELAIALPRCDLVAKTFVAAANPARGFLVSSVNATERCEGRYTSSGEREP
jgi:hypothetical protein